MELKAEVRAEDAEDAAVRVDVEARAREVEGRAEMVARRWRRRMRRMRRWGQRRGWRRRGRTWRQGIWPRRQVSRECLTETQIWTDL